jgi:hypothetical protein
VSLYTVSSTYLARLPDGSGKYIGWPGSSARSRSACGCCHAPAVLASLIAAEADGLAASSVSPRSASDLTWPRSTVSVPVQPEVHQSVPASPSIALAAGLAGSAVVALAEPDSAQFTVGAAPGPPSPGAVMAVPVPSSARAVMAVPVPSSARAVMAVPVPSSARAVVAAPPPHVAFPAWAAGPVSATTASGAATSTAQAAAASRGRRPAADAAARPVPISRSLDLFIKFPFEPTKP